MSDNHTYQPIGVIHTQFTSLKDTPVQGVFAPESRGKVEIFEEFAAGVKDLDTFSHIILLYSFHQSSDYELVSQPMLQDEPHGIFAMRHFNRPNAIGLSVVKLEKINGNLIEISGVDILDKTPILDIKPFIPMFDNRSNASNGWVKPPHMDDIKQETVKRSKQN